MIRQKHDAQSTGFDPFQGGVERIREAVLIPHQTRAGEVSRGPMQVSRRGQDGVGVEDRERRIQPRLSRSKARPCVLSRRQEVCSAAIIAAAMRSGSMV